MQRVIGYAAMAGMMLAGRILSCEAARQARVMQYVMPAGEERAKAMELAEKIAGNKQLTNW